MRRLALVALVACSHGRPPEREGNLDECLSAQTVALDPAPIMAGWQALARGEHPAKLPLLHLGEGPCTPAPWQPARAAQSCLSTAPVRFRALHMPGAGTIVIDTVKRTFGWRPPGVDVFSVDDRLVVRENERTTVEIDGRAHELPGFPYNFIDDDHAIVSVDNALEVFELATGKTEPIALPGVKSSYSGSVFTGNPRVLAALAAGATWTAFAQDDHGKVIASVHGEPNAVTFPQVEGSTIAFAAYRAPDLDVAVITNGVASRQTIKVDSKVRKYGLVASTAGGVVAIVLADQIVIVRPAVAPIVKPVAREWIPALLPGGRVLVLWDLDSTTTPLVLDTTTGAEITGDTARYRADAHRTGTHGLQDTDLGCDAKALAVLPPLLEYAGPYYYPADAIVAPP